MLYLFLAILCSSAIALLFKFAQNRNMNPYVMTCSNYLIAVFISLWMMISRQLLRGLEKAPSFISEWKGVQAQHQTLLGPYNSVLWGLAVGGIAGLFFFFSFLYYQKSVKENGVGLSGTFAKLGILIPMVFSIVIWREYPTALQWMGIILALLSIVMVNISFAAIKRFDVNKTILLLFLFGGIAEFSNKIFQKYALGAYKDVFLFSVFLVAFIISFVYTKKTGAQWRLRSVLTGFAVGIPNLFSSYFLIQSLDSLAASVAFPIFSAGSIVLINVGGFLLFKEKISTKNKVAIGLILAALVLINA